MLAFFRTMTNSWVAKILLSLLIVSFAVWGIKDVFHPKLTNAVVTAGSHEVQPADFKQMFEGYRKRVQQQTGQTLSAQEAVSAGVDQQMLREVTASEAMAEFIKRLGVTPSDTLIGNVLKRQPMFFDSVTGKFDQKAYAAVLAQNGLTPEKFEASIKDEIAQNHLALGMGAGLNQPLATGAILASFELEGRTLSFFLLDPRSVPTPTPPTDQQLQALINQHADQLRRPEMRMLTLVRFSAKALAPTLKPNPADVQKLYNFRKDTLSTPEKRSLVEIPARDAGAAKAIAAKLQAGEAPDAVAKAFGVQPIAYADSPKSAVADPKVAEAAFAMAPGQVSGPVQTGLAGLAVIKVTSVTPAKVANFDEVKAQLEDQVRTDMATRTIYEAVQKYDDAHSNGATLAEAARAAGGATTQVGPVSVQGGDMKGQPVAGLSPKLLKAAFSVGQAGETDLQDDGSGEYFAVRVDKVIAPAVPSVDEIRPELTRAFMTQELLRQLNAKADELAAKIKKGESLEAAAAEGYVQVGHAVAVTRAAMMQNRALGQELAAKLFAAKSGDIVTGQTAQLPVMVARIDAVNPANPDEAARMVVAQRGRSSMQLLDDLAILSRNAAISAVKPTTDLDRARSAIGVSPDDLPKTAASGAKPARAQ